MTSDSGPAHAADRNSGRDSGLEFRDAGIPALLGAAVVVVGSFLPWWSFPRLSLSAWRIPLAFLAQGSTGGSGVRTGPFLLVVVLVALPLVIGRRLPTWAALVLAWVPLAVASCAFVRGLRASPSLHPGVGLILTFGGGALIAADALDVSVPSGRGVLLVLATSAAVILAASGGPTTGVSSLVNAASASVETSALPVPAVVRSAGNTAPFAPASPTTQPAGTLPNSTTTTGSSRSTTTRPTSASTGTTSAAPVTCSYPDAIHITGASPPDVSGEGGEFTVQSTPVVVSTAPLAPCSSSYEIAVVSAQGSGHDCEKTSFNYDVSSFVQVGDLVSVTFELPPTQDCGS